MSVFSPYGANFYYTQRHHNNSYNFGSCNFGFSMPQAVPTYMQALKQQLQPFMYNNTFACFDANTANTMFNSNGFACNSFESACDDGFSGYSLPFNCDQSQQQPYDFSALLPLLMQYSGAPSSSSAPQLPVLPTQPLQPVVESVGVMTQNHTRNGVALGGMASGGGFAPFLQHAKNFYGENYSAAMSKVVSSAAGEFVFFNKQGNNFLQVPWEQASQNLFINGKPWAEFKKEWMATDSIGAQRAKSGANDGSPGDFYHWELFMDDVFGTTGATIPNITYNDSQNGKIYQIATDVQVSPIALDMSGKGKVDLTSKANGVLFDIDGDGRKEQVAWTEAQGEATTGWLALPDADGQITSGKQLFGNQWGDANGYERLKKFDSNSDGIVDSKDSVFKDLRIWQDKNHNGVADAGELKALDVAGVESLAVNYKNTTEKDQFGNSLTQQSNFVRTNASAAAIAQQMGISFNQAKIGFNVDAWLNA